MAKKSTVTMGITVTGDGINTTYNPLGTPIINVNAPAGGPITIALAVGDNVLVVPPNAQGAIIVPPVTSINAKTLKGAGGDTGVPINPALPSMIALPSSAVSFIIGSIAAEDITVEWI